MRTYTPIKLKDLITIKRFYAIEYYETSDLFNLDEDVHDFWELAYIDSGSVSCTYGDEQAQLAEGDLLLISPGKVHRYRHDGGKKATVLFLCFSSDSAVLKTIAGLHKTTPEIKEVLFRMIFEIRSTFTFAFNTDIRIIDSPLLGGQQMTRLYLVELLLFLARGAGGSAPDKTYIYIDKTDNELVNKILTYLQNNVYGTLKLDDLSGKLFYSKSYLNRIFKKYMNSTIKDYYNELKIKEAKKLLRRSGGKQTANSISELLQFDCLSYFIKVFKKYTGLTPIEYKEKLLTE